MYVFKSLTFGWTHSLAIASEGLRESMSKVDVKECLVQQDMGDVLVCGTDPRMVGEVSQALIETMIRDG